MSEQKQQQPGQGGRISETDAGAGGRTGGMEQQGGLAQTADTRRGAQQQPGSVQRDRADYGDDI